MVPLLSICQLQSYMWRCVKKGEVMTCLDLELHMCLFDQVFLEFMAPICVCTLQWPLDCMNA